MAEAVQQKDELADELAGVRAALDAVVAPSQLRQQPPQPALPAPDAAATGGDAAGKDSGAAPGKDAGSALALVPAVTTAEPSGGAPGLAAGTERQLADLVAALAPLAAAAPELLQIVRSAGAVGDMNKTSPPCASKPVDAARYSWVNTPQTRSSMHAATGNSLA